MTTDTKQLYHIVFSTTGSDKVLIGPYSRWAVANDTTTAINHLLHELPAGEHLARIDSFTAMTVE